MKLWPVRMDCRMRRSSDAARIADSQGASRMSPHHVEGAVGTYDGGRATGDLCRIGPYLAGASLGLVEPVVRWFGVASFLVSRGRAFVKIVSGLFIGSRC